MNSLFSPVRGFFLAGLLSLTGCINQSLLTEQTARSKDDLSDTVTIPLNSSATWRLDCLSERMPENDLFPLKLVVGNVSNRIEAGFPLPSSVQEYVKNSFNRFGNGFQVFNIHDETGLVPSDATLQTVSAKVNEQLPISAVISPDVVVSGALTYAEKPKNVGVVGDLLGIESSSIAEVISLSGYLELLNARNREVLAHQHLTTSVYKIKKDNGFFVIIGDDAAQLNGFHEYGHPISYAIQLLFDSLAADVTSELLTRSFNVPTDACQSSYQNRKLYSSSEGSSLSTNLSLKGYMNARNQVCFKFDGVECSG
ncbi:MAG: hypothetical protein K6L74_17185 [Neptuniibacter sp.]